MAYAFLESFVADMHTGKELQISEMSELISQDFEDNANFYEIYKNFDYTKTYKVIIRESSSYKQNVPVKKIILKPYSTVDSDIKQGDYVSYYINGVLTHSLVLSLDTQYKFNSVGRIAYSNNTLKWINEYGVLRNVVCVFNNPNTSGSTISESKYIDLITKDKCLFVQKNAETLEIETGNRFIFGKSVFKVGHIDDYSINNIYIMYIELDELNSEVDNFTLGIADYIMPLYSVIINSEASDLTIGEQYQILYTTVKNGVQVVEEVNWSSSDITKATVDSTGKVTCIAVGNVTITATLKNNTTIADTIVLSIVSVKEDNKYIEVTPGTSTIRTNEQVTFVVKTKNNEAYIPGTYTITKNNTSSGSFSFTKTADTFTVKNTGGSGSVVVNIADSVSGLSITKTLVLKGLW